MQNDIVPPPKPETPPAPDSGNVHVQAGQPTQPAAAPSAKPVEAPEVKKDDSKDVQPPQPAIPKKKSDKPIGVIATAVVLFVLLAGFAVYAGMSGKNLDSVYKSASDISNPNVTDSEKTPEADVDSVITETDSLQGDVQDLDSEVSDQSLGL